MKADAELEALRCAIDEVDGKILELVAERVRLVLAVGNYKRKHALPVYDPERERNLLERLSRAAPAPLGPDTVRHIFERLVDECRRLEQKHVTGR
jgi:chorismate mutase